jgi:hypothetical protein
MELAGSRRPWTKSVPVLSELARMSRSVSTSLLSVLTNITAVPKGHVQYVSSVADVASRCAAVSLQTQHDRALTRQQLPTSLDRLDEAARAIDRVEGGDDGGAGELRCAAQCVLLADQSNAGRQQSICHSAQGLLRRLIDRGNDVTTRSATVTGLAIDLDVSAGEITPHAASRRPDHPKTAGMELGQRKPTDSFRCLLRHQ